MDLARNLIQRINVGDSLTRSAAARPAQPAVVDGPRQWTYAEFNAWVNQLAPGPSWFLAVLVPGRHFRLYLSRLRACSLWPLRSLAAAASRAASRSAGVSRPWVSRYSASSRGCPRSFQIRPWSCFL